MAQVIIGIHGLGNKPPRHTLEKWWKEAIYEGLSRYKKDITLPLFKLIYWADVMYEKPLDVDITNKEHPLYLDEKYTPALRNFIFQEHPVRQKVLDFIEEQLDNIFLNDDLSINFSFITDKIIHNYFREIEIYYSMDCKDENNRSRGARDIIRDRVVDVLREHQEDQILFLGHSMGSIIAYDVLTYVASKIEIDTFVTLGSPLGMPIIMSKVASVAELIYPKISKLSTPPGILRKWVNYSDLLDKVALIYNLNKNFSANQGGIKARDFIVHNNYEMDGEKNPHKSFGYLRTPEFSRMIYRFVRHPRLHPVQKVINKFLQSLREIWN